METSQVKTLRDKAVLVRFTMSYWGARKFDKEVGARVLKAAGAKPKVGHFLKRLLPKEALEDHKELQRRVTAYHKSCSMRWMDEQVRIMPVVMLSEYDKAMKKFEKEAQQLDREFFNKYGSYMKEGMHLQGKMAKKEDYPSEDAIKQKFGFVFRSFPLPDISDWRLDVPVAEMERMKKDAEAAVKEAMADALMELWEQIYLLVHHAAETLGDRDKTFRNTLFENIKKICTRLPKLNLTNDPKLEELRKELEAKLGKQTPDEVRASDGLRSKVASDAKAIVRKMEAYMGKQTPVIKKATPAKK